MKGTSFFAITFFYTIWYLILDPSILSQITLKFFDSPNINEIKCEYMNQKISKNFTPTLKNCIFTLLKIGFRLISRNDEILKENILEIIKFYVFWGITHTYTYKQIHKHTYTHIHTYTHAYTYTYKNIQIHTHTRTLLLN